MTVSAFTGFYDASGAQTDRDGYLVAVVLPGTERSWLRFEPEWKKDVLEAGEIPYLHMNEFIPCEPPHFSHLRERGEGKKNAILTAAAKVTKRGCNKAFAVAVDVAAYREADARYGLSALWQGAYGFATGLSMGMMLKWLQRKHQPYRVHHMFEQGDNGQEQFLKILDEKLFPYTPLPKVDKESGEWLPSFQAADYVAWEVRRLHQNVEKKAPIRPAIHMLNRHVPLKDWFFSRENLFRVCEAYPDWILPPAGDFTEAGPS
jgi:hypothetical protein